MDSREDVLQWADRMAREQRARVRQLIVDAGRPDVLADFDRDMRNLDLGITMARSCWHSISVAQQRVLQAMGEGRYLLRSMKTVTRYDAVGRGAIMDICRLSTARALCAHELIHVNGGATDPEAEFIITERGSFVLKHGQAAS